MKTLRVSVEMARGFGLTWGARAVRFAPGCYEGLEVNGKKVSSLRCGGYMVDGVG